MSEVGRAIQRLSDPQRLRADATGWTSVTGACYRARASPVHRSRNPPVSPLDFKNSLIFLLDAFLFLIWVKISIICFLTWNFKYLKMKLDFHFIFMTADLTELM